MSLRDLIYFGEDEVTPKQKAINDLYGLGRKSNSGIYGEVDDFYANTINSVGDVEHRDKDDAYVVGEDL